MRKDAREVVFKILYSELFNEYDHDLFATLCREAGLTLPETGFAERLINAIHDNREKIDGIISSLAENYKIDRIYPTDRCALTIGIAEMTYFDDVPNVVAIDEAVALSSAFGTKDSSAFVNGIFAKYKTILENS